MHNIKVPIELEREQQWFGSIISRPLLEDEKINPLSPSGQPMEDEVAEHIADSFKLRPLQRIQIYNQQYWWRLLTALQETFPLLTRLLGYSKFNQKIGIPYLVKYPPSHWSLSLLGNRLVKWIEEDYQAEDKILHRDSAKLDWAFTYSFIVKHLQPLTAEQVANTEPEEVVNQEFCIQPYLKLFELEYDLFHFRMEILKHSPDYWLQHEIPKLHKDRTYYFILYRNQKNEISWKEISVGEYHLLSLFQSGFTIEKACDWLEAQDDKLRQLAIGNLHLWFQEWTMRGWLSPVSPDCFF